MLGNVPDYLFFERENGRFGEAGPKNTWTTFLNFFREADFCHGDMS